MSPLLTLPNHRLELGHLTRRTLSLFSWYKRMENKLKNEIEIEKVFRTIDLLYYIFSFILVTSIVLGVISFLDNTEWKFFLAIGVISFTILTILQIKKGSNKEKYFGLGDESNEE